MHASASKWAMSSWVLKWYSSLTMALLKLVGSKQILSFKLPDLSLPLTSTKLLIQGVASCTGFNTLLVTFYQLLVFFESFFKVDRNWATRGLFWCSTRIKLYMVWGIWESSNSIKAIWVVVQNLFLACNRLGNYVLLWRHCAIFLQIPTQSFLELWTVTRPFCLLRVVYWACNQASPWW